MVGNVQTSMFLLCAFVLPVNPIDPVMALVNACPKNESDVIQASNRLGCGKDKYDNNQYLCLPNKEKTFLVEFCNQGVMGLLEKEKGNTDKRSEETSTLLSGGNQKKVTDRTTTPVSGVGDQEKVTDRTATLVSEGKIENINMELEISKPGEGDQEKVTDRTETHVSAASFPKSFKLPFYMEKETVESMLNRLEIGDCIETLKEEDLDLNLLLELSEHDLHDTLEKIKLTTGKKMKICLEIKAMQSRIHSWRGKDIRMVLIGTTNSGKSATRDTIFGKRHFPLKRSRLTRERVQKSAVRFDQSICIVDTPGICKFDTIQTNVKIQKEILKSISISLPGPHAIVLVISISRYTDDEHNFMQYFKDLFGEHFFKYLIILFTKKDFLDHNSLEDHIKALPSNLRADIEKCGKRVIAFNNKLRGEKGEDQVKELLSMIINNVKDNNDCYNSNMYMEAEKRLHERETKLLEKEQMERDKNVCEPKKRRNNKTI